MKSCANIALNTTYRTLLNLLPYKSLKPTVTHVTPFAEKVNLAPHYGSFVPLFYVPKIITTEIRNIV